MSDDAYFPFPKKFYTPEYIADGVRGLKERFGDTETERIIERAMAVCPDGCRETVTRALIWAGDPELEALVREQGEDLKRLDAARDYPSSSWIDIDENGDLI